MESIIGRRDEIQEINDLYDSGKAEFLQSKGIELSKMDIAEAYMVFGGIPYYLNYFQKGMSLGQNVDQLLFDRKARLKNHLAIRHRQ